MTQRQVGIDHRRPGQKPGVGVVVEIRITMARGDAGIHADPFEIMRSVDRTAIGLRRQPRQLERQIAVVDRAIVVEVEEHVG